MKALKLTHSQWDRLKERLAKDYNPSVILIRSKMRNVLGFTPRDHTDWNIEEWDRTRSVHLDFFDEQKRTMFMLKYSEYIQRDSKE